MTKISQALHGLLAHVFQLGWLDGRTSLRGQWSRCYGWFLGFLILGSGQMAYAEQLRIDSSPRRVDLYLNGVLKGQTPMLLQLDAGRYHLELRKSRYLTWASYIQLPARTKMRLEISLEKMSDTAISSNAGADRNDPQPGSSNNPGDPGANSTTTGQARGGLLIVRSEPSGAEVFHQGRLLGRTPLLATLSSGQQTLTLRLDGYASVSRELQISSEKTAKLSIKLVQDGRSTSPSTTQLGVSSEGGSTQLVITSRPEEAQVFLNGRSMGNTPVLSAGLAPGTYQLVIKHKGYLPYQRTLQIGSGQQLRLKVLLIRRK